MLNHLAIGLLIFGLIIGILSIYKSILEQLKYRTSLTKYISYFLVVTNLAIFLNLFYNYFLINLYQNLNSDSVKIVEILYRIIASVLLIFVFGVFISLFRKLIEDAFSIKYKVGLISVWIFLILIFFLGIKYKLRFLMIPLPVFANILIDYLGMLIVTLEIIRTLILSKNISDTTRRNIVKKFSLGFLFIMMVLLSSAPLSIFAIISNSMNTFISALILLMFNLIPLLYLGRTLKKYYHDLTPDVAFSDYITFLINEKKMSETEAKIISLICDGFTNHEISEKLFLSLQTIKDYNYRVFKKFEVSNRVQLTRKFMKNLDKTDA